MNVINIKEAMDLFVTSHKQLVATVTGLKEETNNRLTNEFE